MSPAALLRNVLRGLVPLCLISTLYLYLYPVFLGCAFPLPDTQPAASAFQSTLQQHLGKNASQVHIAPFRLLALGDPQLEGDTSIPNAYREPFSHLTSFFSHVTFRTSHYSFRERVRSALHDLVDFYVGDIPDTIESIRKRIDLFGNDFYLAHIYRTLNWWTKPSHITVLGDLLGSQWISDEEFERRSWRFWNRAFYGAERVPDELATYPASEYDVTGTLGDDNSPNGTAWRRRLINIAGNHDIGYAGDLTMERLERFERDFGLAAYELRFELPILDPAVNASIMNPDTNPDSLLLSPELRIVVINDMNLDTPALTPELQDHTYAFVNDVINTATAVEFLGHFTIVLTHIPLFKVPGVCVDAPFFDFHSSEEGGGVKEQNQLSLDASKGFLEGIFGLHGDSNAPGNGLGRRGVILNGHDHEGCDIYHFINQTQGEELADREWESKRWHVAKAEGIPSRAGHPGLREITVRSMMGGFGGNAGLLSVWFDETTWEWRFEFANCALGRQYLWWFVHIIDLIAVVAVLSAAGVNVDRWPKVPAALKKVNGVPPKKSVIPDVKIQEQQQQPQSKSQSQTKGIDISNGDVKKG
ncbi:hypothetical protein BX600DRAFT_478845 [Xylariales sp. PMI_506]|nr:hypothetical protein BX600DRAFT_478845 [Xylariales sp. PMI_506]